MKLSDRVKKAIFEGTGDVLCMADKLGAFDKKNLIIPISLI